MTLPASFLDEIRARTVLSSLVGKSVKLTKAGREFRGCCPFHNEKTPSFYVNDDKGFYHCFGCSAHGDAIRWITDHNGLPFIDAVRELAQGAGMDMPAQDPRAAETDARHKLALDIMARAQAFFVANLAAAGGGTALSQTARVQLLNRDIDPAQWGIFGIGLAPQTRRGEPSPLRQQLHDVEIGRLIDLGLMKKPDDGRDPYDFFRARIMIPIHDRRGRVIGFGARAIGDAQPKYLNSPDSPLFDKGRSLFNLHRASGPAQRKGRLIVVEGYLDVMAMQRAGIEEVVAPNGTAITETQLRMLWALAACPILCLDGDAAGRKAAVRAAMLALPLLEPGKTLQFAFPPAGTDPDDLQRSVGGAAVSALFADPRSICSVIWEHELAAHGSLNNPDHRALLQNRITQICAMVRSDIVAGQYRQEFAQLMRASQSRQAVRPKVSAAPQSLSAALEAGVLVGLIRRPHVVSSAIESLAVTNWRVGSFGDVADALIDAAIANKLDADKVWPALERAGLADVARDAERLASIRFRFLETTPDQAIDAELVEAINRMPRR